MFDDVSSSMYDTWKLIATYSENRPKRLAVMDEKQYTVELITPM